MKTVVLKVWYLDKQHRHYLGTGLRCKFSDLPQTYHIRNSAGGEFHKPSGWCWCHPKVWVLQDRVPSCSNSPTFNERQSPAERSRLPGPSTEPVLHQFLWASGRQERGERGAWSHKLKKQSYSTSVTISHFLVFIILKLKEQKLIPNTVIFYWVEVSIYILLCDTIFIFIFFNLSFSFIY